MDLDFHILGSSSLGNSALLRTSQSKVLIDAGFSGKRIENLLAEVGESIDSIDAVFLTHEHQDHAQGIRGLCKRADLPIYANRDTAAAVQKKLNRRPNWQIFQTGSEFSFRNLTIHTFSVPHDAYDPVGFSFHWGNEEDLFEQPHSLAWVTDLGYVPEHIKDRLQKIQTLVIESNYDEELLEKDTRRPWSTKQRIRGRHGHLSNDAAYELIKHLDSASKLRSVHLAHLSKDCNSTDKVTARFSSLMQNHLKIHVVDPAASIIPAIL
ncbi:MAG: MBL fold metallo-hydrolase [Puniceicoccaceae bacterium MED-G30]|jgi:phosphoribosyl 1,2-cyclic phosphodiesterase|nr:MAG: MBL fold metallo-hydrolase [Puniceicoccaceae bacterium MED-G30]RPG84026.1 MAG: MBL fold metallo-hydrolase [Coraliomargarita sp. TMED73]|tara:strand:- start:6069 stop:6866 length:798 start_codon:yes stop_codon:yes gene_type:complete